MGNDPNEAWKNKIKWYGRIITSRNSIASTACRRSSCGKYSQDSRRWASSKRLFKSWWKSIQCQLEHFNGRIIFMSISNDIAWRENRKCVQNPIKVSKYARRFPCGRWSFWEPGSEKRWYEICSNEPVGNWTELQERWYSKWIRNPVTQYFVYPVLLKEGFREQRIWQEVYLFNENEGNIELLLFTVICVNQISIIGAIADVCKELNEFSADD